MVDVVVINHDPDVLGALAAVVESVGYHVAPRLGPDTVGQLAAFIREQDPRVVVYDMGPPPMESAIEKWRELCQQPGAHRRYVLTTANHCTLDPHPCMLESVLLLPVALDDVVAAVHRAMQRA